MYVRNAPQIPAVRVLVLLGLLFWPVLVLFVAIGNTLRSLWPHLVIGTILFAPLEYLAICGILIVAVGIWLLPEHSALHRRSTANWAKRWASARFSSCTWSAK